MSTDESNKCIIDSFGGFSHPYSYCVKPPHEMVTLDKESGSFGMKNTGKVVGGIFNYIEYLTINADVGTASNCKDYTTNPNGVGLIGNRYVLKTNSKCTEIDSKGKITGIEPVLHKYINNVSDGASFLTGGRALPDATGVIPSTFASATKIGDNIFSLITSFTGKTKPYCMKASLKCHIVDNEGNRGYNGFSPDVHFSINDIKRLPKDFFKENSKPTIPTIESFSNFDINNINENIIKQNIDKIQNFSDFDKFLNSFNFNDDYLIKTYYIGFSLIIIIIIFKLLHKK